MSENNNNTMSSMLDSLEVLAESPDDGKIVLAFGDLPQKLDTWLTGAESTLSEVDTTLGDLTELREDIEEAVEAAGDAKTDAETHASNAEAWAAGTRGGIDVDSEDPAYHNNAKYYVDQISGDAAAAAASATAAAASATAAAGSESNAADSADEAASSAASATASATAAAASQEAAAASATAASTAATAASGSAISADSARTRAISAAADAQSAATEASSSQVAAESARDAAVTAKDTAVTAKDDAVAAKTAAESAQTAAAASQTAAASSATSASGSATAASNSATSAAASATAADDSAQAAAQSAEDAQDVLDSIPPDYTAMTQDVAELKDVFEQLQDNVIVDSAGPSPIVSIADGADCMPMRSVEVAIEPVQDLHGYDSPWPAGGGVNCLPPMNAGTQNGVKIDVADDGTITINGTASTDTYFDKYFDASFSQGKQIYLCGFNPSAGDSRLTVFLIGTAGNAQVNLSSANAVYSVASNDNVISRWRLRVPSGVTFTNFVCKPMLQIGGSAPTSYSPYSNVCPITGWTGAKVTRTGINIWDEDWENGVYTDGIKTNSIYYVRNKNLIPVRPNTTYYYKTPTNTGRVLFFDVDKTYISTSNAFGNATFTTPENCYYMAFFTSSTTYGNNVSINYPATDTDYHSYQGQTYEVTFPSEAGTVYGGTLDVVAGKLVVDRAGFTLTGNEVWHKANTPNSHWRFYITNDEIATTSQRNAVSNVYKSLTPGETYSGIMGVSQNSSGHILFVCDERYKTEENFRTYLATEGVFVSYTLTNPITYQLTPQEIKTLLGVNNVWSDTGNTSITYPADTKMYIDRKITEAVANALNA